MGEGAIALSTMAAFLGLSSDLGHARWRGFDPGLYGPESLQSPQGPGFSLSQAFSYTCADAIDRHDQVSD
jgi:hypothetical protein